MHAAADTAAGRAGPSVVLITTTRGRAGTRRHPHLVRLGISTRHETTGPATGDLDPVVLQPHPPPPATVVAEPNGAALDITFEHHPQEVDRKLRLHLLLTDTPPSDANVSGGPTGLACTSVIGVGAAIVATTPITPTTVRNRIENPSLLPPDLVRR